METPKLIKIWVVAGAMALLGLAIWPGPAPWFSQSPSTHSSSPTRSHKASITDFGGVGDGKTLNTKAFQSAIAKLSSFAANGGATLYIPNGTWLTGCFNLTDHFTLYLEHGARILGSQNPDDWPVIQALPSYGRGRDLPGPRHTSLIHGEGITDVVITGQNGTIDGQGDVWWNWFERGQLNYSRGSLVEFINSSHILLSNTTFQNSPFWTVHPVYCSHVQIVNVTVLAPHHSHNTDGIDPDSSSDVLIEDCYIETGDDAIAIKSGWNQYGINYGIPSQNIKIHRLRTVNHNGIAIGSEMSGGISNVIIQDMVISNSKTGIHVKTVPGRGGWITNISMSNIIMENVSKAISFDSMYSQRADVHPDNKYDRNAYSIVNRVSIRNLQSVGASEAGHFKGLEQAPYRSICLLNVSISGSLMQKWHCSHVEGFSANVVPEPCSQLQDPTLHNCFGL